uniref:Uncharacterized protein n=1 Tax=Plectus sambesii TaxID=2011161 RepID=A0A914VQE8_9BILA
MSASSCSSTVEEPPNGGADRRLIQRARQQRSTPRPDSREIAKWFGEGTPDKSDVGRSFNSVCFRFTTAKSDSEIRHQSRSNTVCPPKNGQQCMRRDCDSLPCTCLLSPHAHMRAPKSAQTGCGL